MREAHIPGTMRCVTGRVVFAKFGFVIEDTAVARRVLIESLIDESGPLRVSARRHLDSV
jgi:hypothetical protein